MYRITGTGIIHSKTRVESGLLYVWDHIFKVRDLSSILNDREHSEHFCSSLKGISYFNIEYS